jgi:hypothetical protein
MNTTAPAAPKTVNWSSTLTPMPELAHQPSAKSTGIDAAHATASRRRPTWARTNPLSAAEHCRADEAHDGQGTEAGVVPDESGAGRQSDRVADGAGADPRWRPPERAVGRPPLDGAEAGSGERATHERGVEGIHASADLPADEPGDGEGDGDGHPPPTREGSPPGRVMSGLMGRPIRGLGAS